MHRMQQGCMASKGTASQVIPVAESTGQNHSVNIFKSGVLVPKEARGHTEHTLECPGHVPIAVGAREDNDADAHAFCSSRLIVQFSVTGLANKRSHSN